MESGDDVPKGTPQKHEGGGLIIGLTFLIVTIAVFGAWIGFAGGDAWLRSLIVAEDPEVAVAPIEGPPRTEAVVQTDTNTNIEPAAAANARPVTHGAPAAVGGDTTTEQREIPAPVLDAIQHEIEEGSVETTRLPPGHGAAHVTSSSPARIYVDGELQGTTPLDVVLVAGSHRVRIRWEDGRVMRRTVTVRAGDRRTVEVEPPSRSGMGAAAGSVEAVLRADPGIRQCIRRYGSGGVGGIAFRIDASGAVRIRARMIANDEDQALDCYATRLRRIRFPARWAGSHTVNFPP
jgi:hypothetical protein